MVEPKRFRVAAAQIDCRPGHVGENLELASSLACDAAHQGAELVLFPELMPGGYLLTEAIWDSAETIHGRIAVWVTHLAKELGIYLGTTFLEADGEDFYNTFILGTPTGEIAGTVRKSPPASLEAYLYRAGSGSHVIETELGRIGVGICYENLLYDHLVDLSQAEVDLVLQPTAAGRPLPMKPGDIQLFDRMIERVAPRHARVLGAPVVLANRTGAISTPMPGGLGDFNSGFCGRSMIVDADGTVKAKMGEAQGVIVADIKMGRGIKAVFLPRRYGKMWALPVPWYAYIWPLTQKQGEPDYQQNPRRVEKALALSRA